MYAEIENVQKILPGGLPGGRGGILDMTGEFAQ
jgi:hypothetical protein